MTRFAPSLGSTSPLTHILARFPTQEADTRFLHLFEQLPAAFIVLPSTGQIVATNARATQLTGWSRNDLETLHLTNLLAAPAEADSLTNFALMRAGMTRTLPAIPLHTHARRIVLVDLKLTAFIEAGATLVLTLATPAEERLNADKELAQQGRAFAAIEQLLNLLGDPATPALDTAMRWAHEMLGADAIGLYLYTAEADGPHLTLQHHIGVPLTYPATCTPDETHALLAGLTWKTGQLPSAPTLARHLRRAGWNHFMAHPIGDGAASGVLFAAYHPDNPPIRLAPALLTIATQYLDQLLAHMTRGVTLADAYDRALQLAHRLTAINAQITEGVVIISAEGTLDEINPAAARILGYRSEDVVGLTHGDVLFFDEALAHAVQQGLRGTSVTALEGQLRRRNGEPFPVAVSVRPLFETGCVLTLRDLSETRATEIHEEHLDHLAYVGQSTATFAHEVRAPLNNIALNAQYLLTRYPNDDLTQQMLSQIDAECRRLNDLMTDMLAWTKPLEPKEEQFELGALLQRLVQRWTNKMKRQGVKRIVNIAEYCPPVLGDHKMIERVFVNLFENALHVMPAGGVLSISLTTIQRGIHDTVVEAQVSDSGPGMPEDVRRRIFDPYFTTKPNGTGLGLAMSKRIITVHKGGISADSFPGSGTIFKITLPALDPNQPHSPMQLE